jgi:hypothetical protein
MQYVDWVKTGDLSAEWAYEPACSAYSYKAESDLFKGGYLFVFTETSEQNFH